MPGASSKHPGTRLTPGPAGHFNTIPTLRFQAQAAPSGCRYTTVKVLVQDIATSRYLARDGSWVASREDARDFISLLPAYCFARDHTSCTFQVLLYCQEDNFCASIIAGQGIFVSDSVKQVADAMALKILKKSKAARPNTCSSTRLTMRSVNGARVPTGYNGIRRHRN